MPTVRTILATGDVVYDFSLSSGLLTQVSFEGGFEDEKSARAAMSKVVLSKLRIPDSAQSPISGNLGPVTLPSGRKIWGGVIEFGHEPDASGVYKISDPRWHDSVSVWTDGKVMWMQYSRDDTVMGAANANPPKSQP